MATTRGPSEQWELAGLYLDDRRVGDACDIEFTVTHRPPFVAPGTLHAVVSTVAKWETRRMWLDTARDASDAMFSATSKPALRPITPGAVLIPPVTFGEIAEVARLAAEHAEGLASSQKGER